LKLKLRKKELEKKGIKAKTKVRGSSFLLGYFGFLTMRISEGKGCT
jgi:hypothetical protein